MTRISVRKPLAITQDEGSDKGIVEETVGTKTFLTTCQEMRTRKGESHTHVVYTHIDMCMYTYIKKSKLLGRLYNRCQVERDGVALSSSRSSHSVSAAPQPWLLIIASHPAPQFSSSLLRQGVQIPHLFSMSNCQNRQVQNTLC